MACKCRADPDRVVEPILAYFIIGFDILAFFLSLFYIGGGIWILDKRSNIASDLNNVFDLLTDLAGASIAIGIIGVIFSIIGIAAALRQSIYWLRVYEIILILVMTLNLVVGVIFLIYSGQITNSVTDYMSSTVITSYYYNSVSTQLLDSLQGDFQCCGIDSYTDWNSNPYYTCTGTNNTSSFRCLVPASCCVNYYQNQNSISQFCSQNVLADSSKLGNIYTNGCRNTIIYLAQYSVFIVSAILIAITALLLVNVILVIFFIAMIQKEKALYNAKQKYTQNKDGYRTLEDNESVN